MMDCKRIANDIKDDCKKRLSALHNIGCYLTIIQVEGDEASNAYTKGKKRDCEEIGLGCKHILLPNDSCFGNVASEIDKAKLDYHCVGIILQLPLPEHLKKYEEKLISRIPCNKDVDGFNELSEFAPCTPAGIIHIIKKQFGVIEGLTVAVIGRGQLVGKPLVKMLLKENATVIQCHSKTPKNIIEHICSNNLIDVIVTATGVPNTLTADMIKTSCKTLIIDAGISRDSNGKLCGDCDKQMYDVVPNITTVPNGVGLLTRAMLMQNCVKSAEKTIALYMKV